MGPRHPPYNKKSPGISSPGFRSLRVVRSSGWSVSPTPWPIARGPRGSWYSNRRRDNSSSRSQVL